MIRISQLFLFFTATVLVAWALPWFYHFLCDKPERTPFTLYSCVSGNFAYIDYSADEGILYKDLSGRVYTDKEFDSILPFFYYRQLLSDGRLPDTIGAAAVTPQQIGMQNFMLRHSPSDLNKKTAPLYPLLEAMSGRVELKMPPDVFRLNECIEFIDMETNRVDEAKSERFTRALSAKGFVFPARYVKGNPTTRKEYDEGYFLVDASGALFHLKQLKGRPYVRLIERPEGVQVRDFFITELSNRRFYGLISDQAGNFYVLSNPGYEWHRLPVEPFDPRRDGWMIIGDMLHWTVSVAGSEGTRFYALDAQDYSLVDTLAYPALPGRGECLAAYLFPFEMQFTSYDDEYVYPRVRDVSPGALWLNLALAAAWLVYRRKSWRRACLPAAGLCALGIFLLVPLLVIRR